MLNGQRLNMPRCFHPKIQPITMVKLEGLEFFFIRIGTKLLVPCPLTKLALLSVQGPTVQVGMEDGTSIIAS